LPAPRRLTEQTLAAAVRRLARRDRDLARVLADYGPPPLWSREPGFPTLVHVILEQQVSLASARAAFDRLKSLASPLTPQTFLSLDDASLRQAGFSRQKASYARQLAQAIDGGALDLDRLARLPDEAAKAELLKLKGVGDWTADIYLLMALGRPDAWPAKDLALAVAAHEVKRLPARPTPQELETLADAWRPDRAAAAHVLWHYYLNRKKRVIYE